MLVRIVKGVSKFGRKEAKATKQIRSKPQARPSRPSVILGVGKATIIKAAKECSQGQDLKLPKGDVNNTNPQLIVKKESDDKSQEPLKEKLVAQPQTKDAFFFKIKNLFKVVKKTQKAEGKKSEKNNV